MKSIQQLRNLTIIVFIIGLSLVSLIPFVQADSLDFISGFSYFTTLETTAPSGRWAGLTITNSGDPLPSESTTSFIDFPITTPTISEESFPGANYLDGDHYFAAMLDDTFNLSNVKNISLSDLDSEQLFSSSDFPDLYPNYYDNNDNPQITFQDNMTSILLGGENFTAFKISLAQNVDYYLLSYDVGGNTRPLFIVPFDYQTCYKGTSCVGEFLLPTSPNSYNFFLLNKYTTYDYRVWIDGIETNSFPQTALPYNVTVQVSNLYSGELVPFVDVVIGEHDGQNIFVPKRLSGYITDSYTAGTTDSQGFETFLAAPTVYPSIANYSIFVAVLKQNNLISKELLSVASKDTLVRQSKPLTPSSLYDNAKASVNAMNQIANSLFKWSSQYLSAKKFKIEYDVDTNSFTTYDLQISDFMSNPIELKTGAPNVISTIVRQGGLIQSDYEIRIREKEGYLIMNPYTGSSPLNEKQRYHRQTVPASQEFVLTPTSLGSVDSNVTLQIISPTGQLVDEIDLTINPNLVYTGGIYYDDDLLKTIVNAMNQILNSLYYSLNF
ncbi:MAG: hypothetical protein ACQESC_01340 [Nanobdellota archaeon]